MPIPVASSNDKVPTVRDAGADRVSDGAAMELAEVLEKIGMEISNKAIKFAKHAGRKTVTEADI